MCQRTKKKLRSMWVTVMPIVICVLRTIPKSLVRVLEELKIGRQAEQYFWAQLEYWEAFWTPEKTFCDSDSSERPSANSGVKNSQGVMIIIIMLLTTTIIIITSRIVDFVVRVDSNCNLCAYNCSQKLSKLAGRFWNRRTSRDHPDDSIAKISQTTEKSPGDQISLGFHWKTIN